MNVFIYLENDSPRVRHVREKTELIVQPENLTIFVNYMEMRRALSDPFVQQHTIVVLAVESITQLSILSDDHILRNHHRLIAVIPQNDSNALALGHRLKARYIGDISDLQDDIVTVLDNMIAKTRKQEPGENLVVR